LSQTPVKAAQVRQWTERDPVLSKVKTYLLQGWPSVVDSEELEPYANRKTELSLQDGCIFWGARVVVPPPGRWQIVEELHETHPGVSRMKSLARSYVWWPKMDLDLENKVKSCTQCQSNQHMSPPAPLHPWVWPDHPGLDYIWTLLARSWGDVSHNGGCPLQVDRSAHHEQHNSPQNHRQAQTNIRNSWVA